MSKRNNTVLPRVKLSAEIEESFDRLDSYCGEQLKTDLLTPFERRLMSEVRRRVGLVRNQRTDLITDESYKSVDFANYRLDKDLSFLFNIVSGSLSGIKPYAGEKLYEAVL